MKNNVFRHIAAGLMALVIASVGAVVTAPAAHAAGFDCGKTTIDLAHDLDQTQEDLLGWWGFVDTLNGVEVHIITAPSLMDDGTAVMPGEIAKGPDVSPDALQKFVVMLKDYCPNWSKVDQATGELKAKDNLIVIAVAPANKQALIVYGAGVPLDSKQTQGLLAQVESGYDKGQPALGFGSALSSLTSVLIFERWVSLVGMVALIAVVGVIVIVLRRRSGRRRPSRS